MQVVKRPPVKSSYQRVGGPVATVYCKFPQAPLQHEHFVHDVLEHALHDQRLNEWSEQHHGHLNVDTNYKIDLNLIVVLCERAWDERICD
jgi:hypothetical protein